MNIFNDSDGQTWIEAKAHLRNRIGDYSNDYDAIFKVADIVSATTTFVRTDPGWTTVTLSNGVSMTVDVPLSELKKYLAAAYYRSNG